MPLIAADAQNATAAQDGTILYSLPSSAQRLRELVWVDRTGRVTAQIGSAQPDLATAALSPDGRRIAYSARVDSNKDVWIRDLQNDVDSRLTFEEYEELLPAWFPSARRLAYTERRGLGLNRIVSRNADGSGERQELAAGMAPIVSPDGRFVLYLIDERGSLHVRYSEVQADGTLGPPRRVFKTTPEPGIYSPSLAPNGQFLSYEQREQGRGVGIFMTHFPTGEGRWQISRGGGTRPVWARESGGLIFVGGMPGSPRALMAATMRLGPEVVIGAPLKLFDIGKDFSDEVEVAPDGKRFIMIRGRSEGGSDTVRWVLVQNWFAEVAGTH